jgi:transcription initiation factor TFIIH subunit 4
MTELRSSVKDYLEGLPEVVLTKLYTAPATCLAIFRLLPDTAKILVMTMNYKEGAVNIGDIEIWFRAKSQKFLSEALQKLKNLHLIKERFHNHTISLNATFKTNFKTALMTTSSDLGSSFGVPCDTEDKYKVDIAFLDQHATEKWESILHFMVGTRTTTSPSPGVLSLLVHSGLMYGRQADDMRITSAGFQFLLQDINSQIWTLLLQYLNMAANLQMNPVDVLNFIFMLGSLELGKDYSLSALSVTQVKMLEDLRDFGIVYQRKSSSRRFYPTRLATTLTSDSSALRSAGDSMEAAIQEGYVESRVQGEAENETSKSGLLKGYKTGFIILETNYKLYAYTDSPLQIAVLNLFCHLKTRFANMVTGHITRDSIRNALANGIMAEQIISYLTVHAHSQMRKADPILPPTVVDQIKLWQLEMDRITASAGYLYTNFTTFDEYSVIVSYATELGVVLWHNSTKRQFFVTDDGHHQVLEFVRRRSEAHH